MTELDDLLSGIVAPGVYRWHGLLPPRLVGDDAAAAGWRWGYVAGYTRPDRHSLLVGIGETLGFPAYFGANLDALWDGLSELSSPTLLGIEGWARLARADADAFDGFVEVVRRRAAASAPAPPFAVLLWGEGPPVGVRSLD